MSDAAAGWYPDPYDPALVRWWDGEAWTEVTRKAEPEPARTPPAPACTAPLAQVFAAAPEHGPIGRPWWKKKRYLIPASAVAALMIGGALNPPEDDEPEAAAETTLEGTTSSSLSIIMEDDGDGRLFASSNMGMVLPLGPDECQAGLSDLLAFDVQFLDDNGRQVDTASPFDNKWVDGRCIARVRVRILAERLTEPMTVQVGGRRTGDAVWSTTLTTAELFASQSTGELLPIIEPTGITAMAVAETTTTIDEEAVKLLTLRAMFNEAAPNVAAASDEDLMNVIESVCEMAGDASSIDQMSDFVLILWGQMDESAKDTFGGNHVNLVLFSGAAMSLWCPDEFERLGG